MNIRPVGCIEHCLSALNIKEYGFKQDGQWLSWLDAQFIDACHCSFDLHSAILRKIYQSMDLI